MSSSINISLILLLVVSFTTVPIKENGYGKCRESRVALTAEMAAARAMA
jgi:hypothetical protein